MLVFHTLTTIFIHHSPYIPAYFSYFLDVLDTTTIRTWISYSTHSQWLCIISFTTTNNSSHILCMVLGLFHDTSFPIFICFIYTLSLSISLILNTSHTRTEQRKSKIWTFCHCNSHFRLNPQTIFSQITFICSIIFQPRSRYIYIFQEYYCHIVLLVFNQFSCTPGSNLQCNMRPMHNTFLLV